MPLDDSIRLITPTTSGDERRLLHRDHRRGVLERVARGAYVPAEEWGRANAEQRHLATIVATSERRRDLVFGHLSAALLHGLPLIVPPPQRPDVVEMLEAGGRSDRGVHVRASVTRFEIELIGSIPVTTLARTLVDIAKRQSMEVSVAMIDFALAAGMIDKEALVEELARHPLRGRKKAEAAIAFADPDSDSPGESASRVVIFRLGFPEPVLQQPFYDGNGLVGIGDFWWKHANVIGEFDGLGKYVRPEFLKGRTPAEAVVMEKRRENRLRRTATRPTVARWEWPDIFSPSRLRRILHEAGLF